MGEQGLSEYQIIFFDTITTRRKVGDLSDLVVIVYVVPGLQLMAPS